MIIVNGYFTTCKLTTYHFPLTTYHLPVHPKLIHIYSLVGSLPLITDSSHIFAHALDYEPKFVDEQA